MSRILHIGCVPLLNLYVKYLQNLKQSKKFPILCFSIIVKEFGFYFQHSFMDTLFVILADRGIPYDYIKSYLIHDNELNVKGILNKIESLDFQWNEFWMFKAVKGCIVCGMDLVAITPITQKV